MPTSGVTAASSHVTKLPSALKTSYSIKATLITTQCRRVEKEKRCPACTGTHIATGSNGNPRLSNCETFISESVENRAGIIAAMNGCVICLDYSGSHQAYRCQAKDEQGKMFEPCKQLVKNGSPCGDWHNHLLHGSRNHFCNSIEKKDSSKKPPVEEENMEVDEEDQDYSEVMNDPAFLQSVLQNLPGVDPDSEAVKAAMGAMNKEEQTNEAALMKEATRKAKAAEKAAKKEATKRKEPSVEEGSRAAAPTGDEVL